MSLDLLIGTFKSESRFKKRSQIYVIKIPDAFKEYFSEDFYVIPINEVIFGVNFFYFLVLDKKEYDAKEKDEKDFKEKFSGGFTVKGGDRIEFPIQCIQEKYRNLNNAFYFLGCGDHIEIWLGLEYEKYLNFIKTHSELINQTLISFNF
ncbi:MAG: hypothetical protein QXE31_03570 [Candidatus Woesearchaeota archaeon]